MDLPPLRHSESEPLLVGKIIESNDVDISTGQPTTIVIKRFSKRLLLVACLIGVLLCYLSLTLFSKNSLDKSSSLLFLLPDDIYKSIVEKLPAPLSNAMLYLLADKEARPGKEFTASLSPGEIAKSFGFQPHYPVFIIPGMTSTGLELWETDDKEYADSYFRDRLWGTLTMMRFLIFNKKAWLKHLVLDLDTGLDPQGIRLRPAQGLAAADFLVPGYWVWGPIIKNLGTIGYDPSMLHMAAYDWRLSICDLEKRDRYFTALKHSIESSFAQSSKKAVVICHSLGSLVFLYFFSWISNQNSTWVNDHIHSFVNIAGPLLGTPKTISSLISGDMKDTLQLGIVESVIVESLLSRKERAYLFRRWPGIVNLLPKGSVHVWSNKPMIHFSNNETLNVDQINEILVKSNLLPPQTAFRINQVYNTKILDPLQNPLPNAPNMTLYSFYGVGKETEIGYHYKLSDEGLSSSLFVDALNGRSIYQLLNTETNKAVLDGNEETFPLVVDTSLDDSDNMITKGVILGDGDGTVPIQSLGMMGTFFWKNATLNPHNVKIVTREYLHEPIPMSFISGRGGPKTSDHVDILGNHEMTFDILRIVSGKEGNCKGYSDQTNHHISLVKGNVSYLSKNIPQKDIRELNFSLGRSSDVLYEEDISFNQSIGKYLFSMMFSKSSKMKTLQSLQNQNIINKLVAEADELPMICDRYFSKIEQMAPSKIGHP